MWQKKVSKYYPNISASEIWDSLVDVNHWPLWQEDLEGSHIQHPFEKGTTFSIQPKGHKPVQIEIVDLKKGTFFKDCTSFWGAKMYDLHFLEEEGEGVRITNCLQVTGLLKYLWVFLVIREIAQSMERQMDALVQYVRMQKHG